MQLQGFRSQLRRAAKTPAKQRGAVCSPSRVSLPDPRTRLWPWVVSAGTDLRPRNAGRVRTGDGNGSAGRRERQSGALTGLVGRGPTPERCWITSRSKDLLSPCCFPSPRSHFHPPALQNQKLFKAQRGSGLMPLQEQRGPDLTWGLQRLQDLFFHLYIPATTSWP